MTSELRPAVEVWRDAMGVHHMATKRWALTRECPNQAAAAVIEADREAVRAEQAAELAKWRDKYNELGQMALEQVSDLGTKLGRLDVEIDAAKADLQAANRELAKYKALAETLAGALEGMQSYGCPVCNGDCGSANPPVIFCPMTQCGEALRQYKEAHDAS